ncbi:hemolysin III family protein [uncultured Ruthenibacterium sp.]|uniref:PAQR family membrane homeostasis protein TrhA n=1 Tax=uncultured Ruthenibacterium sp. TaxID=1905347 RepID=UPI00349E8566
MVRETDPTKFYTKGEEIFNAVSHGMGSLLSIVGTSVLVTVAALFSTPRNAVICLVYGLSLVILYTMSTLYHSFPQRGIKCFFRILDHSTIYLLIAGSYTPFTLILLRDTPRGTWVCAVIWAAALLGVTLNAIDLKKFEKVSMVLYVAMGWAAIWVLPDILHNLAPAGFWLLLGGGLCYTGGIVFYAWHKIRYMHGIWHLFVLAGSVLHYLCIFLYVLPPVCEF